VFDARAVAHPPPMMTMHVVSSVSGRSASQSSAAADCALDGVIMGDLLSPSALGDIGREVPAVQHGLPRQEVLVSCVFFFDCTA
jgi:hypothetical protein